MKKHKADKVIKAEDMIDTTFGNVKIGSEFWVKNQKHIRVSGKEGLFMAERIPMGYHTPVRTSKDFVIE